MARKLIEVSIPLTNINDAAVAEKKIKSGYPANIHMWWARRPLAASRAVIFAQLVDDPSEHPDRFPDETAIDAERERLFELMRQLADPTGPSDEVLRAAQLEIGRAFPDGVTVLDPFAGGGSIPIEAQRLGLDVGSSDLNPVAVLLNRVLLDQVRVALGMPAVHPDDARLAETRRGDGLSGLAEDLVWYGRRLRELAEEKVGDRYPTISDSDGKEWPVISWIWARTTPCPNPACGIDAPLVRSFIVSKKKGREAWVDPVTSGPGVPVEFVVRDGPAPRIGGTVSRAGATCVACGTAIPLAKVREDGLLASWVSG